VSLNKIPLNFRLLFIVILLTLGELPVHSQEHSGTIIDIEITGLKRTKQHIARYPLEIFLGREAENLDMNEVKAAIKDMGILEPEREELIKTDEGFILNISVTEKWSIFPLPILLASSDDFNFGINYLDANAFGQRDMMTFGFMYGSMGWMAIAAYLHTPNRSGLPGWNGIFMYGTREIIDLDKYKNIHRQYSTDQFRLSLGLNYPFTHNFSISTSLSFTNISLKKNEIAFNQPEEEAIYLGISTGISLRYSDWDGFLLSQRSLSLGYSYNHALLGSSYHQVEYIGIFERSLVPGFRINIRSGAVFKTETDALIEGGPQRAQVDILPARFSASNYAGLSAGFEKYIIKFRWGTISALGSWQAVFSYGTISDLQFDNGLYVGGRLYLSRMAISAVGMGFAYNMNSGLFQFGFNMGIGF
jgi:outer membrane protein assembly factor BamA